MKYWYIFGSFVLFSLSASVPTFAEPASTIRCDNENLSEFLIRLRVITSEAQKSGRIYISNSDLSVNFPEIRDQVSKQTMEDLLMDYRLISNSFQFLIPKSLPYGLKVVETIKYTSHSRNAETYLESYRDNEDLPEGASTVTQWSIVKESNLLNQIFQNQAAVYFFWTDDSIVERFERDLKRLKDDIANTMKNRKRNYPDSDDNPIYEAALQAFVDEQVSHFEKRLEIICDEAERLAIL